jgi:hypothetical protein
MKVYKKSVSWDQHKYQNNHTVGPLFDQDDLADLYCLLDDTYPGAFPTRPDLMRYLKSGVNRRVFLVKTHPECKIVGSIFSNKLGRVEYLAVNAEHDKAGLAKDLLSRAFSHQVIDCGEAEVEYIDHSSSPLKEVLLAAGFKEVE